MDNKPVGGVGSPANSMNAQPNQVDKYASKPDQCQSKLDRQICLQDWLGVVHILIGVVAMGFTKEFYYNDSFYDVSNGWGWGVGSLLFMASGSLAILGGCKKTKILIVATLILSILSAIAAFSLLVFSRVFVDMISTLPFQFRVKYYLGIALMLIMLIVATISAILAAKLVYSRD